MMKSEEKKSTPVPLDVDADVVFGDEGDDTILGGEGDDVLHVGDDDKSQSPQDGERDWDGGSTRAGKTIAMPGFLNLRAGHEIHGRVTG